MKCCFSKLSYYYRIFFSSFKLSQVSLFSSSSQPVKLKKQMCSNASTTIATTTTTTSSTSDTRAVKLELATTTTISTSASKTSSLMTKKLATASSSSTQAKNITVASSSANSQGIFVNTAHKTTTPSFVPKSTSPVTNTTNTSNILTIKSKPAVVQLTKSPKPSTMPKVSFSSSMGSIVSKPTFVLKSTAPNSTFSGFVPQKMSQSTTNVSPKVSPVNTSPRNSVEGSANRVVISNSSMKVESKMLGVERNVIGLTSRGGLLASSKMFKNQNVFVAVTDVKEQMKTSSVNVDKIKDFKPTKISNMKSPILVTNLLKSPLQQQGKNVNCKDPERIISHQQIIKKSPQYSPSERATAMINRNCPTNQPKSTSITKPSHQDATSRTFVGEKISQKRAAIEIQKFKSNLLHNNNPRVSSTSPLLSGKQHFSPVISTTFSSNHHSYTSQSLLSSSSGISNQTLLNKSPNKGSNIVATHQPGRRSSLPEKLDPKSVMTIPTTMTYTNNAITDLNNQYQKFKDQNETRQSNTTTIQHLKHASLSHSMNEQHSKLHHPSKKIQIQKHQHFTNVISSPVEKLRHSPVVNNNNAIGEQKMSWPNNATDGTRQALHHRTETNTPSSGNKAASLSPSRYKKTFLTESLFVATLFKDL